MSYKRYCAACMHMSENSTAEGKYWCKIKNDYVYADKRKCRAFFETKVRSESSKESYYNNSFILRDRKDEGCYLTTIVCDILKYPDNNYYLNTLRQFRDHTMKDKYIQLLLIYDIIGPIISEKLAHDPRKEEIATTIFSRYIVTSVSAIEEGKYHSAINVYASMTYFLAQKYNINIDIINFQKENTNHKYLGHARIKKKSF